jgi:hypothetical protein
MTETELLQAFYEDIKGPAYPEHTVGWYMSRYPEPYRSQAIENTLEDKLMETKYPSTSLECFLIRAQYSFVWRNSPQGQDYWARFFNDHKPWREYERD